MSELNPSAPSEQITWPDLSAYGITLGMVTLEGDKKQLVYADMSGKYKHIAKNMGFAKTKWEGLWVRSDTRVEASAFRNAFPKVIVARKTPTEISDETHEKIRQVIEASQQTMLLPGFEAVGPVQDNFFPTAKRAPTVRKASVTDEESSSVINPSSESVAENPPVAIQVIKEAFDLSPLVAQSRLLGSNISGEDVFEQPGGSRFIKFRVETESGMSDRMVDETNRLGADEVTSSRFLRGDSDASLSLCAKAFVKMMSEGHTARVDELHRFFHAVTGREFAQNDPDINRVIGAIDEARVDHLRQRADGSNPTPDDAMFNEALTLHNAAQYYTAVKSNRMTPLPMGVIMQHIVSAMPIGASIRVENAQHGEFGVFGDKSPFRTAAEGEQQDVLMAAYSGKLLEKAVQAYGTAVTREDHANVLQAFNKLNPNGLGIFVIEGDAAPGRIGPSSRRFLDALANMHEIEGIVDVDGNLMGVPGALPSRVIVVGKKREVSGHGGLPPSLPYVTDYESLWAWGTQITEEIRQPGSVPYLGRGGVSKKIAMDNAFQTPYIPASMLSDPALMIPRNLASPVRRAMLEVMKQTPHVDTWLEKKLEYKNNKALADSLSAEQADAVTMGLHRAETGLGFMVADQTGIGKGRIISSLARAARTKGEPVLFLTEKAELFTDLWRDIEDTSSEEFFKRVFIINDGAEIVSTKTGEIVAKSAPRDQVEKVMRSMQFPPDVDIVMATYSQFNRDPVKAIKNAGVIDLNAHTKSELSASSKKLMDWVNLKRASEGKKPSKEILVEAINALSEPEVIAQMPLAAVKSLWIGKATKGTTLIMDESHNASGESSQTNLNLTHGVMAAENVFYSSATFARGEKNMRIYRRLFPKSVDVEGLHETLKKGGEATQEALTSMLAEDGALIRREHDLSMLKFSPRIDNQRQLRNEQYSDKLSEILAAMTSLSRENRLLSDALSEETKDALSQVTGPDTDVASVGVVKRNGMGSNLYMIMRAFLSVLKADLAVEEAVTALKEGRKPVLVIDHTMEADLDKRIAAAKANGEGLDTDDGFLMKRPGFKDILRERLSSLLKVSIDGEDLNLQDRPNLAPIISQINKLIEAFPDLPTSPIDVIRSGIEKAGYGTAELSGRKKRVRYLDDGNILITPIKPGERKVARDRFNNGDADAIILTRAGNAGISLHDSYRFINKGQRELVEVEVPEDVIARMQFFGRVNRNGQQSYPIIKTLSTGLPAENRVLALQNNKLRKLSANVNGDRDNAAITKEIPDILNSVGNEVAYRFLENDPVLAKKLDIDIESATDEGNEVEEEKLNLSGEKFINELLNKSVLLLVKDQRAINDTIFNEFQAVIEELDAKGENPLRPKFYDVHAKKLESEALELSASIKEIEAGQKISSFDKPVSLTQIQYTHYDEPMPARDLVAVMKEGKKDIEDQVQRRLVGSPLYDTWAETNPDVPFQEYVIDTLVNGRETLLERFLGQHLSIAEAMAAPEGNMVKNVNAKVDSVINMMATIKVGSRIRWHDEWRGTFDEFAVVTRILPADEDQLHNAGQYRLRIAVPGSAMPHHIALSALMAKMNFEVLDTEFNPQILKEFDSSKRASYTVTRPVLDGNQFRAAEMSIQTGLGVQAFYSDETGLANCAVVMPVGFKGHNFNKLPLRLHDKEMVKDFFASVDTGSLHSTSGAMRQSAEGAKLLKKGMSIQKSAKEFIVSCPGNQQWVNWLKSNSSLMEVTGPFGGSRSKLFATVPLQDADKLLEALYKTGLTMYAHSSDSCSKLSLQPGEIRERMHSYTIQQRTKAISVRSWFAERFGADLLEAESTKDVKVKDPFAMVDAKGRSLRAM